MLIEAPRSLACVRRAPWPWSVHITHSTSQISSRRGRCACNENSRCRPLGGGQISFGGSRRHAFQRTGPISMASIAWEEPPAMPESAQQAGAAPPVPIDEQRAAPLGSPEGQTTKEKKPRKRAFRRRRGHSPETRLKISNSMTGNKFSLDHRFRLSQAQLGRFQTDEIRDRIREGVRRSWERRDGLPADRSLSEIEVTWLSEQGIQAFREIFPSLVDCLGGDQVAEMVAAGATLSATQTQSRSRLVFAAKSLRRQLCAWLRQRLELNGGDLPDLRDLRDHHPVAYEGFVRFFALMHALREVDREERRRGDNIKIPGTNSKTTGLSQEGGLNALLDAPEPGFKDLWNDLLDLGLSMMTRKKDLII